MKSALWLAPEKIEIRDIEIPKLEADEVLIQPLRMGICGSDVSFFLGHRTPPFSPFTLGHEFVGRVADAAPGVTKLAPGQRVIVEPNYCCGTCRFCRTGRGSICPNKRSMGVNVTGCFAEYATAPAEFTWPEADLPSAPAVSLMNQSRRQTGPRAWL